MRRAGTIAKIGLRVADATISRRAPGMKHPLCKIDNIPSEGMKLIPFIRCEVHVYKANGMPNTTISICTHFEGQLGYKDGSLVC